MKTKKGKHLLLALCLAAALLLASCGPKTAHAQGSSQGSSAEAGSADSSGSDAEEDEDVPTQSLQGTVNLVDEDLDLLVLVSDEIYYKFDTAKADISGLAPGDAVTVTYTGTLDPNSDLVSAVLVSISKDAPEA